MLPTLPTLAIAILMAAPALAQSTGPRFRPDGLDAERYGIKEAYPPCTGLTYINEQRCRVGALSHFDTLFPARAIHASKAPAALGRAPREPDIRYTHDGKPLTLNQYLDKYPVSGLLIAKGDTILVESYQYARNDKHRMTSFSMAKSITSLLVGHAVNDGAIRSIDDHAETYVTALQGTEYGRTPIKALLQMASGVSFQELYRDNTSDIYTLALLTLGQGQGGSLEAVKRFNARDAKPGERYSYSSAETVVLGLVVKGATGRNLSDYTAEKLWDPIGAEAAASWNIDATGQEITYAYFNAVLRDWARLGLMLAHDGQWRGKTVVPRDWLLASTTIGPDSPMRGGNQPAGVHRPGYGYQFWLLDTPKRTFALKGLRGQWVMVDPESKLVLVQTAVRQGDDGFADQELMSMWKALVAQPPP
ncbi:MAG TPA: serine hydrolase [Ramlibacter sp.]|nr:serine hydrolase [Ramlibacter sp.]